MLLELPMWIYWTTLIIVCVAFLAVVKRGIDNE
jgi:hypothetical protein